MTSAPAGTTGGERFQNRLEIFIAVGLGLSAILTALCVYLEDIHDDRAQLSFNEGVREVTEATGAYVNANSQLTADEAVFREWYLTPERSAAADDLRLTLMRKEIRDDVSWWRHHFGVGPTPFTEENPRYTNPEGDRAEELTATANASFTDAKDEQEDGDRFIVAGVIVATALFLFGIAGVAKQPRLKLAMTIFGYTVFFASAIVVVTGL
jgi:hypothetical protein